MWLNGILPDFLFVYFFNNHNTVLTKKKFIADGGICWWDQNEKKKNTGEMEKVQPFLYTVNLYHTERKKYVWYYVRIFTAWVSFLFDVV